MPPKKNQHYVPKFYLRNFSYQNNKKEIGIYNIQNSIFFNKAKLKTQGSKTYYYGKDKIIENSLERLENLIATTFFHVCKTNSLPIAESYEHFSLLLFIAQIHLRNPVTIGGVTAGIVELRKQLLEEYPSIDIDKFIPTIKPDEAIQLSISQLILIASILSDLDYKLVINRSPVSFISSDFPIVKYNQFIEKNKLGYIKSGFASLGLQIFLPISPELLLTLYDPQIYKFGNKKDKIIVLKEQQDIDQLNLLQLLNCLTTLFFDESICETYIKSLHKRSTKFQRANIAKAMSHYLFEDGIDKKDLKEKNLLTLNTSECKIKLDITQLKIHSGSKKHKENIVKNKILAPIRKKAKKIDALFRG